MRCFKIKKDAHLAEMLLRFTDSEQNLELRGTMKNGYVKLSVLEQYFGDEEMRKAYPKDDIERVLTTLVNAGLLEEREY